MTKTEQQDLIFKLVCNMPTYILNDLLTILTYKESNEVTKIMEDIEEGFELDNGNYFI